MTLCAPNPSEASSVPTPLVPLQGSKSIWLKDESQQVSGAFKFRGAFAKLKSLDARQRIVTASTGNHGVAVANAAFLLKRTAHVFLPTFASEFKVLKILDLGAHVTLIGDQLDDCARAAQEWAKQQGAIWFSGFDDDVLIQGYRPLFTEIREAELATVRMFVPVGGGGLLAAALLEMEQDVDVIGVQSVASESMERSLAAGRPVRVQPGKTIATGLAVPMVGTIPYQICSRRKPRLVSVSDEEIRGAMRLLWQSNGIRVEPAGAATLGAALRLDEFNQEVTVCIVSGGNIAEEEHEASMI